MVWDSLGYSGSPPTLYLEYWCILLVDCLHRHSFDGFWWSVAAEPPQITWFSLLSRILLCLHVCIWIFPACVQNSPCMYVYIEREAELVHRRKFRSQTSDNMGRWKAEQGRGREKRKTRREKIRGEKESEERRCRCAKGRKVAKHCVFQWFVAPEGRKVGSLKPRVRSQLARWEMKNCTPLWREAHFEIKM